MISFVCNICGQSNTLEAFHHEESSCNGCGSNVRLRALVYMLSMELFGEGFLLPEFPCLPAIKGLGLSDQENYADRLAKKFDYINTFYDRDPYLDITQPHPERYGTYDFILSSDVFEHIAPPVERAFDEAHKLLKPHGLLCLSVPFSLFDSTLERFPGLHEFAVVPLGTTPVLINRTKEGALEIRDDLIFHGGEGATLEMRIFSHKDLESKLRIAGFKDLRFLTENIPGFGIFFENGCSLPLVARKEDFVFDRRTIGQLAKEYNARNKDLAELRSLQAKAHAHIDHLDDELATRGVWATGLQQEILEARAHLERIQAEFDERTRWTVQLREELEQESSVSAALRAQLDAIAESRWIKLGNRLGLGPKLKTPNQH